jgi:hypothetical protein
MAIQDRLALVNCGGFLRAVGPDRLELSDAQESVVRLGLTLERTANYRYRVGDKEFVVNLPYATPEIHFAQCLTYLGAFREQPEEPVWLRL